MAPSGVETHQVRVVTTPVKAFCTLINIWENKNVIVMHFFSFVETSLVPIDERKIVIFFSFNLYLTGSSFQACLDGAKTSRYLTNTRHNLSPVRNTRGPMVL